MPSLGNRKPGFTLIEIVVVLIIIALMIAAVVPAIIISNKRASARSVRADLVLIDQALQRYAAETGKPPGTILSFEDIKKYVDKDSRLHKTGNDQEGNPFGPFSLGTKPSVPDGAYNAYSDVVDVRFWSPFR